VLDWTRSESLRPTKHELQTAEGGPGDARTYAAGPVPNQRSSIPAGPQRTGSETDRLLCRGGGVRRSSDARRCALCPRGRSMHALTTRPRPRARIASWMPPGSHVRDRFAPRVPRYVTSPPSRRRRRCVRYGASCRTRLHRPDRASFSSTRASCS
jgi:hypothetical protein